MKKGDVKKEGGDGKTKDIQGREWPFFFPSVYHEMCWCRIVLWMLNSIGRNMYFECVI